MGACLEICAMLNDHEVVEKLSTKRPMFLLSIMPFPSPLKVDTLHRKGKEKDHV